MEFSKNQKHTSYDMLVWNINEKVKISFGTLVSRLAIRFRNENKNNYKCTTLVFYESNSNHGGCGVYVCARSVYVCCVLFCCQLLLFFVVCF